MRILTARLSQRLQLELLRKRVRAGIWIAGGSPFEYWGRIADSTGARQQEWQPSEEFVQRAAHQFAFLKELGLKPEHKFLDYGCSILRTGLHVAPYLAPGHYVGAEVSQRIMHNGVKLMSEHAIPRTRYHLVTIRGPDLVELTGFTFDFVFANSVLQYLSDSELATVMSAFRRHISPEGTVFASFPDEAQKGALARKGNYYRSPERMRALCEAAGFSANLYRASNTSAFPTAPYALLRPAGAVSPAPQASAIRSVR